MEMTTPPLTRLSGFDPTYDPLVARTPGHGSRATVLEANQSIGGCTSRNGGQGQNASGRLYRSQWIERWGKETALKLDAEIRAGFGTFKSLVAEFPCDAQPGG